MLEKGATTCPFTNAGWRLSKNTELKCAVYLVQNVILVQRVLLSTEPTTFKGNSEPTLLDYQIAKQFSSTKGSENKRQFKKTVVVAVKVYFFFN